MTLADCGRAYDTKAAARRPVSEPSGQGVIVESEPPTPNRRRLCRNLAASGSNPALTKAGVAVVRAARPR